jgi:trk system potassium uptake protein
MKQSFVIIGLGRFGGSICRTLVESGQEVLAIDSSEDRVNEYMNIATHAVVANAQDEMTLRSLGIRNFDHVIVAIGEDIQASILVTLMVKEMGVPNILAKAQNEYHARVLDKIGADRVVHLSVIWGNGSPIISCLKIFWITLSFLMSSLWRKSM